MLTVQNTALKSICYYFFKFLFETVEMKIQSKTVFAYLIIGKSVLHLLLSNIGFQGDLWIIYHTISLKNGALPKYP